MMPPARRLEMIVGLALLSLIYLSAGSTLSAAMTQFKNASLIDPLADNVTENSRLCNLEYQKCEFKLMFGKRNFTIRVNMTELISSPNDTNSGEQASGKAYLAKDDTDNLTTLDNSTAFTHCFLRNEFFIDNHLYQFCHDESRFLIRNAALNLAVVSPLIQYKILPELPISAVHLLMQGSTELYIYTFDMRSNMIGSHWSFKRVKGANFFEIRFTNQYPIMKKRNSPIAYPLSTKQKPWAGMVNVLHDELYHKFSNNIEERYRAAFVGAVTPMYLDYSERIFPHNQAVALCVHRNNMMDTYCMHNGQDHSNNVDQFQLQQSSSKFISHAYHLMNYNSSRYVHFVYTVFQAGFVSNAKSYYLFCKRDGVATPNSSINQETYAFKLDGEMNNTKDCFKKEWAAVDALPTDIIGFNDGKCMKTIAFYHGAYVVGEFDKAVEPLHAVIRKEMPDYLVKQTRYVQAAMSIGRKIYFFAGSNTMVTVTARMDPKCQQLTFDKDSVKEMFTQPFIYANALRKPEDPLVMAKPYIVGHRYADENVNESDPAVDYGVEGQETLVENPDGGPGVPINPKPANNTSTVVIIVIGCILGGLILASIIYMFWIRSESPAIQVRARKSQPQQQPSLTTPTMRSAISNVPTESKMVTKSPMPPNKSRAGSPKSRSKKSPLATILSKKSLKSPKSSKSKMNRSPKSKSPNSPKSSSKKT